MEWFKWIFGNRFWPFPPTSSVSFMHLHEWDWWAFWWSGESLCPVFPQNTCRCLKFCLLYFQFYFVTFSSSNSCLKLRYSFSKHLTICLYLFCSILSCFCTALCYAHCLNVWKNTAHIPDDNIQLCFCVNDSQTLSNAQKWNHNACGRHYYRLCHFLLLVKGLYKVNQGHWRWCAKQTIANIFFGLTYQFTFSKLRRKHFLLTKDEVRYSTNSEPQCLLISPHSFPKSFHCMWGLSSLSRFS